MSWLTAVSSESGPAWSVGPFLVSSPVAPTTIPAGGGGDRRRETAPTLACSDCSEEVEGATVAGGGDKLLERTRSGSGSLVWEICSAEGLTITVAVTVDTHRTTTQATPTQVTTIPATTTPATMATTSRTPVSATTSSPSGTSTATLTGPAGGRTRPAGPGATPTEATAALTPGSHRGSPTTPGPTRQSQRF